MSHITGPTSACAREPLHRAAVGRIWMNVGPAHNNCSLNIWRYCRILLVFLTRHWAFYYSGEVISGLLFELEPSKLHEIESLSLQQWYVAPCPPDH